MTRILVVNPLWPRLDHFTATNVVLYEWIEALAAHPGVSVGFLKVGVAPAAQPTEMEQRGIDGLKALGVEILDPLVLPPAAVSGPWTKILLGRKIDFYPGLAHERAAYLAASAFKPDLLFLPWTETYTALYARMPVAKVAYYGNPDPKSLRAAATFAHRHGGQLKAYVAGMLVAARLERAHLDLLRRYDHLADVAANDAQYYREHGIERAFYIQNVWVDRFPDAPPALEGATRTGAPVIIANVGQLGGTANTHGLELLGRDILPALRRLMGDAPYEVHILGRGKLHSVVEPLLDRPEVKIRGFVDDIDREMAEATVFLCANNGSAYNVGHTRYLHAWSLGCCVVAHTAASTAMPEITDQENALLGQTSEDVACQIAKAIGDPELRRRLGLGGYRRFKSDFTARQVAPKLLSRIGL